MESHHDRGAYEAPLVLNLPAEVEVGKTAAGWWASRFEKLDRRGGGGEKWRPADGREALHRALQLRLLCGYRSAFVGVRFRAWLSRLRGE